MENKTRNKYLKGMMQGPYDLTKDVIDKEVKKDKPGNYLLTKNIKGEFDVNGNYVGRSDNEKKGSKTDDLNTRLKVHIKEGYKRFKFCNAKDAEEAYKRECVDYHYYKDKVELENKNHPGSPDGKKLQCLFPRCEDNKKNSVSKK